MECPGADGCSFGEAGDGHRSRRFGSQLARGIAELTPIVFAPTEDSALYASAYKGASDCDLSHSRETWNEMRNPDGVLVWWETDLTHIV